jgi:hypothetical protein
MKRNLIGNLSLVALLLLLTTTGAYAQSHEEAYIPFTFNVGVTQFPAGTYVIKEDHVRQLIRISNVETGTNALAIVGQDSSRDAKAELVFHALGNQHFLARICGGSGADSMDLTLSASKQERQLWALQVARGPENANKNVMIALK